MTALRLTLVLFALASIVGPARADCVSECRAFTYCDNTAGWDCGSRLGDCYRRCQGTGGGVSHGALAYGKTSQAWGYSYGFADTGGARSKAMANCRRSGGDCAVVADFANGCAAVAAGAGPAYAVAQGKTGSAAKTAALKACRDEGVEGCEIQVWGCAQ